MLIYYEEQDSGSEWPRANFHNLDTGVTYTLEILPAREPDMPVLPLVMIVTAESKTSLGRRLAQGDAALALWTGLASRGPFYNGNAPYALLARLQGRPEPILADSDIPF